MTLERGKCHSCTVVKVCMVEQLWIGWRENVTICIVFSTVNSTSHSNALHTIYRETFTCQSCHLISATHSNTNIIDMPIASSIASPLALSPSFTLFISLSSLLCTLSPSRSFPFLSHPFPLSTLVLSISLRRNIWARDLVHHALITIWIPWCSYQALLSVCLSAPL